jgi:hypothetical protein
MFKFLKIAALWLTTLLATIAVGEGFSSIGAEWVGKIAVASFYGYFLLLATSFVLAFFKTGLSKAVWWTVSLHLLTCSVVEEKDIEFMFGPLLGIAVCYVLLNISGKILSQKNIAA